MRHIPLLSGQYEHVTGLMVDMAHGAPEAAAQSLVNIFCSVRHLTLVYNMDAETARRIFPVLQQLRHLQRLQVNVEYEAVDFQPARSDCVIDYTMAFFSKGSQELHLPAGLARHVGVLRLGDKPEPELGGTKRVLNLGNLNHCHQLEFLDVLLFGSEEDSVEIVGLRDAPASLQKIHCRGDHDDWQLHHTWHLTPGWCTSEVDNVLILARM
jgi:hypothetical protein